MKVLLINSGILQIAKDSLSEDAVSEIFYLSRKSYEKLREDLDNLKKVKAKLSEEIGEAARQGDLKENAEYMAAKEKQAETLAKINELELRLRSSRITDDLDIDKTRASIGATVTIEDISNGEKTIYTLVGSMESNPDEGLLSVRAPVAAAILGKEEGDVFEVILPRAKRKYKLIKLEYK